MAARFNYEVLKKYRFESGKLKQQFTLALVTASFPSDMNGDVRCPDHNCSQKFEAIISGENTRGIDVLDRDMVNSIWYHVSSDHVEFFEELYHIEEKKLRSNYVPISTKVSFLLFRLRVLQRCRQMLRWSISLLLSLLLSVRLFVYFSLSVRLFVYFSLSVRLSHCCFLCFCLCRFLLVRSKKRKDSSPSVWPFRTSVSFILRSLLHVSIKREHIAFDRKILSSQQLFVACSVKDGEGRA